MSEYLRFRDRLKALLDEDGMYAIDQLDRSLLEGHSQLWTAEHSALVTGIIQYEGGAKIGQADWAVGEMNEILFELMPKAEAFMRASGCEKIMFEGRPGWGRVLKSHGYRPHSVTVVKEL